MTLPDAAARADCADLSRHVLATAPAGSGKTGLLVQRLLRALATVEEPEQVVAITFTNKAAAEIRHRVAAALRRAQQPAPAAGFERELWQAAGAALARSAERNWQLLEHPSRVRALTMDALNAQLAAQAPLGSGLGGPARIEEDAQSLYQQAVLRVFALIDETEPDAHMAEALRTALRGADNRLDRLMEPLCRLLERREQWLPELLAAHADGWQRRQDQLLQALIKPRLAALNRALSEPAKAELVNLLREGSAHHELLRWAAGLDTWPVAEPLYGALYTQLATVVVTDKGKLRSPQGLSKANGFPSGAPHVARMRQWLATQAGNTALEVACAALLGLPDAAWPESLRPPRAALVRLLPRVAQELKLVFGERGAADFTEVAQAALNALRPEGGYGEALLRADRRLRHLLVDEMQDTSESQIRLLEQLTSGWEAGDGRSLFLVGDPQQSIYGFRKAEVQLFLKLLREQRLGTQSLHCVNLLCNFRSAPKVVEWFNSSFSRIFPERPDPVAREVPFTPSVAQRVADPQAQVRVHASFSDEQEGERVAECVAALLPTLGPEDRIALLVRSRRHLVPALAALRRRNLRYQCRDVDLLTALPGVRDVIALARALWHPYDHLSWALTLRAAFVGLAWADLIALARGKQDEPWETRLRAGRDHAELSAEGRARVARLLAVLDELAARPELRARLADRTEFVWRALDGRACVTETEHRDVAAAFQLLRSHAAGGEFDDLRAFERALQELYASPTGGQIEAMTVHKAKGLEFEHVLLLGCSHGTRNEERPPLHLLEMGGASLLVPAPPDYAPLDDAGRRLYDCVHVLHVAQRRSETLRLLYVAATRAKRSLHLFVQAKLGKDGEFSAPADSFAGRLKPVIAAQVKAAAADGGAMPPPALLVPLAPRLPLDYARPALAKAFRPRERRTLKPSEAVLSAHEDWREREHDLYARLVGTLYHETLRKIAQEGLGLWADAGESRRASLAAGFRRLALPDSQVQMAVERVLAMLKSTLAGATGRWLLSPKPWARSEYHLAGYHDGAWVSALIDRCFEEPDGTLWAVDYKTAAAALDAAALEDFMLAARERYQEQLNLYAQLLRAQRPGKALRAGFYFPDGDRLVELDTGGESAGAVIPAKAGT